MNTQLTLTANQHRALRRVRSNEDGRGFTSYDAKVTEGAMPNPNLHAYRLLFTLGLIEFAEGQQELVGRPYAYRLTDAGNAWLADVDAQPQNVAILAEMRARQAKTNTELYGHPDGPTAAREAKAAAETVEEKAAGLLARFNGNLDMALDAAHTMTCRAIVNGKDATPEAQVAQALLGRRTRNFTAEERAAWDAMIKVRDEGNMSDAQRQASNWFARMGAAKAIYVKAFQAERAALRGLVCYYCRVDTPAIMFNAENTSVCQAHAHNRGR